MSEKKKLIVQVPNEIIRNNWFNIDANTFSMYVLLKFLLFRNFNNNEMSIDHSRLKNKLYINDNRTLKKIFKTLHMNQMILEYITRFPRRGTINISFNPEPFESKGFTQLPINILNKIDDIGAIGVRLLFYYESFINRKDKVEKHFAFPAIETISKDLNINHETVIKYNEILRKKKLIKIVKHELTNNGDYDEFDRIIFTKYNNHYYVKLENI